MIKYLIIWIGQVTSTIGSSLTSFALSLWIYDETGSVSLFALNLLAYTIPSLITKPFAGVLADRWHRKWLILGGDTGSALMTLIVFALASSNTLAIWHIYLLTAGNAVFLSLQWPAYMATIPLIVPQGQLGRASGLTQVGDAVGQLLGPLIAGSLYVMHGVGVRGILLIDFTTFLLAVATMLMVPIPRHKGTQEIRANTLQPARSIYGTMRHELKNIFNEMKLAWEYVRVRTGLFHLLLYFTIINFLEEFMYPLAQPLLFEIAEPDEAGQAIFIMALGMVLGIGIMTIWGGPKRRMNGILIPGVVAGIALSLLGLRPSLELMIVGGFLYFITLPIIEGSDQVIWQTKVAEEMQGRVFALTGMIATILNPLALIVAGPLSDYVFEPLLQPDGRLADSVGRITDVGDGRGIGFFIVLLGLIASGISMLMYFNPTLRLLEDTLPDVESTSQNQA